MPMTYTTSKFPSFLAPTPSEFVAGSRPATRSPRPAWIVPSVHSVDESQWKTSRGGLLILKTLEFAFGFESGELWEFNSGIVKFLWGAFVSRESCCNRTLTKTLCCKLAGGFVKGEIRIRVWDLNRFFFSKSRIVSSDNNQIRDKRT